MPQTTKPTRRHPMQEIVFVNGVARFRANPIINKLVDVAKKAGYDLNSLMTDYHLSEDWTQDDYEQFCQLIGYSISGFHELSNVSDETALQASAAARDDLGVLDGGCRNNDCEMHCGVGRE